jgi:hypothetical protein
MLIVDGALQMGVTLYTEEGITYSPIYDIMFFALE